MGKSIISHQIGGALASYPHAKQCGQFLFISGLSARQRDDSVKGVRVATDGSLIECDIGEQTEAVFEKYKKPLFPINQW
jgi:2-aminomuconate deaminase